MCIYITDNPHLTYTSEEHVFPASLGGKLKLPRNAVSTEANNMFSKMEEHFIQYSFISLERSLKGPGKRGSLSPNKESTSEPYLTSCLGGFSIVALSNGAPIVIPQLKIHKGQISFACNNNGNIVSEIQEDINSFLDVIISKLPKCVFKKEENLESKIIGLHHGKVYIFTKNTVNLDEIKNFLTSLKEEISSKDENFKYSIETKSENSPIKVTLSTSADDFRVICKIVLNALCYIKGENYVKDYRFNDIRDFILRKNDKFNDYPFPIDNKISNLFSNDEHFCIFQIYDEKICASVGFYGKLYKSFLLGNKESNETFEMCGLVCDWKNQRDMSLIDFIQQKCNSPNQP